MLLLIDNYDSFTYNLVQCLGEIGIRSDVRRNDALAVNDAIALMPQGIILSPGPCGPETSGICPELIKAAAGHGIPLLGVCLGHQAIGHAFGGTIVRHHRIVHGKTDAILTDGSGLFARLPREFAATRYHSLVIEPSTLPDVLRRTAWTKTGTIMGVAHREHPIFGVQFHPESIASEQGHALLGAFAECCGIEACGIRRKAV
ncbi:MAG: aminodeoxychorismate/anthranilate synthase component II [Rhodobacteraceae bacterium]|nr:aminodeoxychorismate/anthranilate synthase component II [Paracoccaceae bacterium]